MDSKKIKSIPVTVDKSHLITIGERMYAESIELIRELVSNAYDADATEVYITITDDKIVVEDNGTGMSEKGLRQYFNIGSPEKRIHKKSPRFGRLRIGEFGIGKFASLSACDKFEVQTKKRNCLRTIVFDKKTWQDTELWELPIYKESANPLHPEGTKVTLYNLKKKFNLAEVERRVRERIPIRASKFAVFLNGKRITAFYIPGQHFPIKQKTLYGEIYGDIIVASNPRVVEKPGIECKVRGVTIKREMFGLESLHEFGLNRIVGEVHADFLLITSDRSNFIIDSPEYKIFYKIMQANLKKITNKLKKLYNEKENKKISKVLREVLDRVKLALLSNPDFCPRQVVISGRRLRDGDQQLQSISVSEKGIKEQKVKSTKSEKTEKTKEKIKPQGVIRRFKIGNLGVTCSIEHLGEDGPECFTEGNIVFINRDHPLYRKYSKSNQLYITNLARLLTQEISMMKGAPSARSAFERQSKLLTDALTKSKSSFKEISQGREKEKK